MVHRLHLSNSTRFVSFFSLCRCGYLIYGRHLWPPLSLLSQIEEGRAEQNNALPFVFITFLLNLTSLRDEQPDYEHGATFLFVSIAFHEF